MTESRSRFVDRKCCVTFRFSVQTAASDSNPPTLVTMTLARASTSLLRSVKLVKEPSISTQIRTISQCPACYPSFSPVRFTPRSAYILTTLAASTSRTTAPSRSSSQRYLSSTSLRFHADRGSPADDVKPRIVSNPATIEHPLSPAAGKATQPHSSPEGAAVHSTGSDVTKITEVEVTEKEQSRRDWEIIKKLIPNIWPKNDWGTKTRVLVAVGLLVGGKVRLPSFLCRARGSA